MHSLLTELSLFLVLSLTDLTNVLQKPILLFIPCALPSTGVHTEVFAGGGETSQNFDVVKVLHNTSCDAPYICLY